MGAPLEICRKRTAVAVLASGVVISLSAMTGGIAPAFAAPKNDPAAPTTTVVVPEPEQQAPQEEAPPQNKPEKAPEKAPEPPAVVEAPPQTKAPEKAPEPPAVVEAPPQTQAPQTQAPVTQAPQTQAPQTQEPVTQAPQTQTQTQTQAPVTQSSTAKPSTAAPSTASDPATSAEPPAPRTAHPSTAEQAPATSTEKSAAPAPSSETSTTTSVSPSTAGGSADASTAPSPALVAPKDASQDPAKSGEPTETSETPASESEPSSSRAGQTASSSVSQAAKEIETVEPQTLKAPEQDVVLAKSAKPVEELLPAPAPKQDVAEFARAIDLPNFDRDFRDGNASRKDGDFRPNGDRDWNRHVRQWDPDWVQYDDYYRPVICNPYHNTVKIIYIYQNAPRIVYIPPLARIVLEVAQFAAYSFTAIVNTAVNTAINTAVNVAVGSFFGGGYFPGIGLPLPPPPPPVWRYDNVPVQVRYSNNNVYEPFRVQRIVDVGNDSQYGERKVLLDGVTPAWGEWTQNAAGERQFEIHKTQQFPGLDEPREGPLPGDYQLRLASDQSASDGFTSRDIYLMASAGVLGLLSLGAVLWAVMLGRRRTLH